MKFTAIRFLDPIHREKITRKCNVDVGLIVTEVPHLLTVYIMLTVLSQICVNHKYLKDRLLRKLESEMVILLSLGMANLFQPRLRYLLCRFHYVPYK
jgi:hypothetical protein